MLVSNQPVSLFPSPQYFLHAHCFLLLLESCWPLGENLYPVQWHAASQRSVDHVGSGAEMVTRRVWGRKEMGFCREGCGWDLFSLSVTGQSERGMEGVGVGYLWAFLFQDKVKIVWVE